MSLFGRKEREEIERLRAQMSPEQQEAANLAGQIAEAQKELEALNKKLNKAQSALSSAERDLAAAREQIIETDEAALMQSFGVYTPHYAYSTSDEYKEKIAAIRAQQKELIKNDKAVSGNNDWTVNGSKAQGRKMVKDMKKLLLRAFNAECDDAIEHVRFNNVDVCERKIRSSAEAISKLGDIMSISIFQYYVNLKLDELSLVHEYQVKKQEEKEEAKELRARQREEAKVQKELEESRKKLEKEQTHYSNELEHLEKQIAAAKTEEARKALEEKKAEITAHLGDLNKQIEDVDYRVANQRAGYVYVISNIGAFGENVYKIGMTRRLDPMERVDELGDASVPFNFDVHAMIFTDDAPGLEAALHTAFEDKKLNFVNKRREFFAVTLDEIKRVIYQNYDKTVEFVDVAPAEQYRQSLLLKKSN